MSQSDSKTASHCVCQMPADVFNGVCGVCLMPVVSKSEMKRKNVLAGRPIDEGIANPASLREWNQAEATKTIRDLNEKVKLLKDDRDIIETKLVAREAENKRLSDLVFDMDKEKVFGTIQEENKRLREALEYVRKFYFSVDDAELITIMDEALAHEASDE